MQYLSESVCVFFKMGKNILQDTSWAERGKMMDVSLSSHGDRSIIWHITSSGSAPCNPRTQWLAAEGEVNFPFTRLKINIFFQAFRISVSTFLFTSVKSKTMMNVFNMGFAEAMNRRTNSFLVTLLAFLSELHFVLVIVFSCFCLSHTGFIWSQLYWGQIPAVSAPTTGLYQDSSAASDPKKFVSVRMPTCCI